MCYLTGQPCGRDILGAARAAGKLAAISRPPIYPERCKGLPSHCQHPEEGVQDEEADVGTTHGQHWEALVGRGAGGPPSLLTSSTDGASRASA